MKVASLSTQLRLTFAIYLALLAAVLSYHVRTSRNATRRAHELTALADRQRLMAHDQVRLLAEMQSSLEKFSVTGDAAYVERAFELSGDVARGFDRVAAGVHPASQRLTLEQLMSSWAMTEQALGRLADSQGMPPGAERAVANGLAASIDTTLGQVQQAASYIVGAIEDSLTESTTAAQRAERIAIGIAAAAFAAGVLLSFALLRAIMRPLERLAHGTRQLSSGRFDHRLAFTAPAEFAGVARDFNAMAGRLEELDRLKKDFVSTVSHDLKTPLSSMQETVEVLLEELPGPLTARQRKLLELNRESARRLAQMLAKLLDLSRLEAETTPHRDVVDLAAIVRDSVERFDVARPGRGPAFSINAPATPLWVRANAGGIEQVLENLLENAMKFSPPGGTIRVAVADLPANGTVLLSVADEGPGVPDVEKDRVFDRFHQTGTGRAAGNRGVGLGLSICRHIVNAHDGIIWVADHEPRGAVFCVVLPGPAVSVESAA